VIVVWCLDRLGRSLKHLVGFLAELGERGVQFRSLTEAIDTTTASGKLLFNTMGSLAEFERALIVERTHAGLAAARTRGRRSGRPRTVGEDKIAMIRQLYDSREHSVDAIARMVGVGAPPCTDPSNQPIDATAPRGPHLSRRRQDGDGAGANGRRNGHRYEQRVGQAFPSWRSSSWRACQRGAGRSMAYPRGCQ
jgi:hypothetical protein